MTLNEFFKEHKRVALAFSGGVDSAYLLYSAVANGADVRAYFVQGQFQPELEVSDALKLARGLGIEPTVIKADILSCPEVAANPSDRCYHCKKNIMGLILGHAKHDGYEELIDGTNASDDLSDRPGAKALSEYGILSPLRSCGLEKGDIRKLSKEAGLFIWDKPAYACLATRVATGEPITAEKLQSVEYCESFIMDMGFADFRVRTKDGNARLEFIPEQMERATEAFPIIEKELKKYFNEVVIDPNGKKKSL